MSGARFIMNARFFHIAKPGEKLSKHALSAAHVARLVEYCGTRESVALNIAEDRKDLPATKKQIETLNEFFDLLEDYKETLEYDDYIKAPTRQNASELISRLSELLYINGMGFDEVSNLVEYAAKRPGAVKIGEHGLFSSFENVDLENAKNELSTHKGNIWTEIYSLRREDADRLGYDSQKPWRDLVMLNIDTIAKAHRIKPENLRWYAAMHNTSYHPHIHLFVYSTDPTEGFLNQKSIQNLKSAFATKVFANELEEIYSQKDHYKKQLNTEVKNTLTKLLANPESSFEDEKLNEIANKMLTLSQRYIGKAVYGFQPKEVKAIVNDIEHSLVSDNPLLSKLYGEWCNQQFNIERLYVNNPNIDYPIENNPTFTTIKNTILKQAQALREYGTVPALPSIDELIDNFESDNSNNNNSEINTSTLSKNSLDSSLSSKSNDNKITFSERRSADSKTTNNNSSRYDPIQKYMNKYPEQVFYSPEPESAELKEIFGSSVIFESDENAVKNFKSLSILANDLSTRNGEICRKLGDCYNYGQGTEKDFAQAVLWYGIAADEFKDSMSSYRLGQFYLHGFDGLEKNLELGHMYCQNAFFSFMDEIKNRSFFDELDKGNDEPYYKTNVPKSEAYKEYLLGRLYLKGEGVQQNHFNAYKAFMLAAENGCTYANHSSAKYGIGLAYLKGKDVITDNNKAILWLEKSTLNGNASAAYKLGTLYESGEVIPQDNEKAFLYYQISAELDNPYACYKLGNIFLKKSDISQAIKYFEQAADKNISHAWYRLGQIYSDEQYGVLDAEKSNACFSKALQQYISDYNDNPDSFTAYRIGQMYLEAKGTNQDISQTINWFEKSVQLDNPDAAYQLGYIYKSDVYGVRNDVLSNKYFSSALSDYLNEFKKNPYDADLAMRIGTFYNYGLGVEHDINRAISWYKKSVELGNQKAQQKIDDAQQTRQMSVMSVATTACHLGRILNTETMAAVKNRYTSDSKLLRKEKIQRIEAGQAISDSGQSYDY